MQVFDRIRYDLYDAVEPVVFLSAGLTDFFLLERNKENDVVETIKELCKDRLPAFYEGRDPYRDIQVLTPARKGLCGSVSLRLYVYVVSPCVYISVIGELFAVYRYRVLCGDNLFSSVNDRIGA